MIRTKPHRGGRAAVAALVALTVAAGCGKDTATTSTTTADATTTTVAPVIDPGDGGSYAPQLDPADFVDVVDNPYFPLAVGSEHVTGGTGTSALISFTP